MQNKDKEPTCLELLAEARDMLGNYMFYYDEDGDSYNNGDVIAFIEKLDDFLSQNKAKEEPNARS